jgi:hypothetical protein
VYKKRKGFYLWGSEVGEVGAPSRTIREALDWEGNQYGGEDVEIDMNIQLEEVFEIMNTSNFEPLLNNMSSLRINGVPIDVQSLRNFVAWYATYREVLAESKG